MSYHLGFKTGTLAALRQFRKSQASLIDNSFHGYDYGAFRMLPDLFGAECLSHDPWRFFQYPVAELVLCHQCKPGCWEDDYRLLDTTIHVASIPGSDDCMMGTTECASIVTHNDLHGMLVVISSVIAWRRWIVSDLPVPLSPVRQG